MEEIYTRLTEIFREVFDNPDIHLKPEITADDIEEWDSMTHMNLIMMIEVRFGIEFDQMEVLRFENVGDLAQAISSKTV